MRKLIGEHLILIATLRAAIELDMRFYYQGDLVYDPADFAYYGA